MTPAPARYEVSIDYCNDANFTHKHRKAIDATKEYAQMLSEAIEPAMVHPEERHVRSVGLTVYNDMREVIQKIDSGVFPCEHRPDA